MSVDEAVSPTKRSYAETMRFVRLMSFEMRRSAGFRAALLVQRRSVPNVSELEHRD